MKALHQLFFLVAIFMCMPLFTYAQPCFPVINPLNGISIDVVNFNGLPAPPADIYLNVPNDMEIIITNNNNAVQIVYINAWLDLDGDGQYQAAEQIITQEAMSFPSGPATYGMQIAFTPSFAYPSIVSSVLITATPTAMPANPCIGAIDGASMTPMARIQHNSEIFAVISQDGIETCLAPFNPQNCSGLGCLHPAGCMAATGQYQYADRLVGILGASTGFPVGIGPFMPSGFTLYGEVYREVTFTTAPNAVNWQTANGVTVYIPMLDVAHSICTGNFSHIPMVPGNMPSGAAQQFVLDFAHDPINLTEFHTFYWVDGQQQVGANIITKPVNLFTVNGLQSKDYGGEVEVCPEGFGSFRSGTAIEPVLTEATLTVAPNPFERICQVQLELPEAGAVQYQLRDLQGRSMIRHDLGMFKEGQHELLLDMEMMSAGIYVLQVQAGNQTFIKKIMKTH